MLDDKRQWYKAKVGIPGNETPIEETFCQYTVVQDELLEISDALLDERVKNNPHVKAENGIRFYAGMPLIAENGYNIGTVCVVGDRPKKLNKRQRNALKLLTKQAMHLLESRKMNTNLGTELNTILEKKIAETQKKLELKENENKSLMQAIKNSSGVVEFMSNGTIISINRNFEEISGYTEKELLGSHHNMFITPADYAENNRLWDSLSKGEYKTGRVRRIHKDGSEFYLQATYNPIQNLHGHVIKVVKI
jgi:PAS domain S-box-containing protein